MELFILRHGIAELRDASSSMKDSERSLTLEGERKTRRIAKGMEALALSFDVILTSPFRRARQTADIVAAGERRDSGREQYSHDFHNLLRLFQRALPRARQRGRDLRRIADDSVIRVFENFRFRIIVDR